jgi:MFS family permease
MMSPKSDVEQPQPAQRRGYFVQRMVRAGELPSLMNTHILTGAMGTAWGTFLTGIIYIYFGNAIGMSQLGWGILGGITSWVVVVQPLGAILGARSGSRKRVWFWSALADRVLRLAGVIGAFLLWQAGHPLAFLVFIAGISAGSLVGNISFGPWYGWLSTIIPSEMHGTFWGRRDSWISLAVALVTLPSALVMDLIPQEWKLEAAALILLAASLIGYLDLFLHARIPEPPFPAEPRYGSFQDIASPLRNRRFRPWLVFIGCWNFSQGLGGALSTLYFMENLGFKNDLLGGMFSITIVGLLGTLLVARWAGRMVDRVGIKRVLLISYFSWTLIPFLWLFATPGSALLWVGLGGVIGGIFSASANNAGVKLVTRFPSPRESGMYMAVSTMVASISNGIAAVCAGAILNALGGWTASVFGLVVSSFPLLFMISFVLRMVSTLVLIPRIRVSGAPPEQDQPFLLPLFFEGVPGISRLVRAQKTGKDSAPRWKARGGP